MSMILAPKILPADIAPFFFIKEVTIVTSSGRLVPIATSVTAIIPSGIFMIVASALPLSTNNFAPKTIAPAPKINFKILIITVVLSFLTSTISSTSSTSVSLSSTLLSANESSYKIFGAPSACIFLVTAASFFATAILSQRNTAKGIKSIIASQTLRKPVMLNKNSKAIDTSKVMDLRKVSLRFTIKGENIKAIARISPVFAVTEPIALPIAISTFPCAAAIIETIISGRVVATLTIVAPMIN